MSQPSPKHTASSKPPLHHKDDNPKTTTSRTTAPPPPLNLPNSPSSSSSSFVSSANRRRSSVLSSAGKPQPITLTVRRQIPSPQQQQASGQTHGFASFKQQQQQQNASTSQLSDVSSRRDSSTSLLSDSTTTTTTTTTPFNDVSSPHQRQLQKYAELKRSVSLWQIVMFDDSVRKVLSSKEREISEISKKNLLLQQQQQKQQQKKQESSPSIGGASMWKIVSWLAKSKASAKKRSFILLREKMCDIIAEHESELNMHFGDADTWNEDESLDESQHEQQQEAEEEQNIDSLRQRTTLLHESSAYRTAMHEFFESMNLKRMPNFKIRKLTYMKLLQCIYRVLSIQKKVDKNVLEFDWKADCGNHDMMDFDLFFRAMLELTECFCYIESEDECVTFIRCLHREVARRAQMDNPRAPFIIFRENDIDHNIRQQMRDMQERMKSLALSSSPTREETLTAAEQIGFIQYYSSMSSIESTQKEEKQIAAASNGQTGRKRFSKSQLTQEHFHDQEQLDEDTRKKQMSNRPHTHHGGATRRVRRRNTTSASSSKSARRKGSASRGTRRKSTRRRRPHTSEAQQRTEKRYQNLLKMKTGAAAATQAIDFPYNDTARQHRQFQSAVNTERHRIRVDNRDIKRKLQSARPRYYSAAQSRRPAPDNTLEQIIGQRKMRSANDTKSWTNLCSFLEQGIVHPSDVRM